MNHVTLVGRLTSDPTVSFSKQDQKTVIAKYTLAVSNRSSKDDSADFIQCVSFKKAAEFAQKYFKKGQRVAVEGRIKINSYTDKDGIKRTSCSVVCYNQEFADSPAPKVNEIEKTQAENEGFTNIDGETIDDLLFED